MTGTQASVTPHAEIGTLDWTREIADRLDDDSRFGSALSTWDGAFAIRTDDGATSQLRVYHGSVIDSGARVGGDLAFTLTIPRQAWQRMLAADDNTFMNEAMLGSFRVEGSGYEYLRLAKPLSYVVDAARTVAGVAAPAPVPPGTSVPAPVDHWRGEAHYLFVDGSLSYVEIGQPEGTPRATVLLLHTAGQSGVQYRRVVPGLTALGYRTVVPDYPGHGRSEPCAAGPLTDLGDLAGWVEKVIGTLDLADAPLVIAGCSIGGKITIDLATRLGDRIAGAVAMAASADPGLGNRKALLRELEDVAAPSRAERTTLGTRAVVGRSVSPELRELIATMHRREDPVVSNSDLLGWTSHDVTARLAEIACPLLLVGGADDLWLDLDAMRRTAQQVSSAQTLVLDGIGHYPPQEMPDFAERLDSWIGGWLGGQGEER